jgi:hypothetical protein
MRRMRFTLALTAALLSACASLPSDSAVVEQLDNDTGATVTRLGHPIELYRETFRQDAAGRFAFLGPFETNQMGQRELFLWIALPVDAAENTDPPSIEVNGTALSLEPAGRSADFAGLKASPYKIPTPWIAMYYFKIDATVTARLAEAHDLAIEVLESTKSGMVKTEYAAQVGDDPRLREFANR